MDRDRDTGTRAGDKSEVATDQIRSGRTEDGDDSGGDVSKVVSKAAVVERGAGSRAGAAGVAANCVECAESSEFMRGTTKNISLAAQGSGWDDTAKPSGELPAV